jgi:type IV fimbrial biogenesis protein FimT
MAGISDKQVRGFTVLEALVVLALCGILLALAAPSMSGWHQQQQMQSQAEQLRASLMLARSEALRRQQRVTLCVQGALQTCASQGSWAQGWLVFVDTNANALREPDETLLQVQAPLPALLTLQGNATVDRYISYGQEGRSQSISGAFQAGTLTLCAATQAHAWRVVINPVGKPRLEKKDRTESVSC